MLLCLLIVCGSASASELGRSPPIRSTSGAALNLQAMSSDIPALPHVARSDWLNVKDPRFGAVGDGVHDDAAAIQLALHEMVSGIGHNGSTTVYFPPGTYLVKKTLLLGDLPLSGASKRSGMMGGNLIGHGRDSILKWGGPAAPKDILAAPPADYSILWDTGSAYFNFKGLTWDGAGTAAVGVDHFGHGFYATFMLHRFEEFSNFTVAGIRVGGQQSNPGQETMATAEIRFDRCKFRGNFYGVLLQSFNDLDNMFHGCHFADNQIGVSTTHGNFYIMDSRFERSNISDTFNGGCCAGSSIRRTVSIDSAMLAVIGGWCGVGQPAKIHDCRVEGFGGQPGATAIAKALGLSTLPAVALAWRGPLSVVDSTFIPAAGADGGPAVASWNASTSMMFLNLTGAGFRQPGQYSEPDWARTYLLLNNSLSGSGEFLQTLSVDAVYNLSAKGSSVGPSPITAQSHFLPKFAAIPTKVFEAKRDFGAAGDGKRGDADSLQQCIDAAASHGAGATCYLGPGAYAVNRTLMLHGRDYVFEGSGSATMLVAQMLTGHQNDSLVSLDSNDAFNITIQQMWMNNGGRGKLSVGPPASGASPRLLFADYLMMNDNETGIVLRGLGATDTVLIGGLYNPLSVIGSSAAVVLVNFHEGGYTTVAKSGANHGPQIETTAADAMNAAPPSDKGFMGELVKVPATGVAFSLLVRDSENYVCADFYEESNIQIVYLSGSSADTTPGYVTMSNVKHHTSAEQSSPLNNPEYIRIDGYHGDFAHTGTAWMQADPLLDQTIRIDEVRTNPNGPLQMLMFGDSFADCVPVFNLVKPSSLFLLGNNIVSLSRGPCNGNNVTKAVADYCGVDPLSSAVDRCMLKDTGATDAAETIAATAFDHLRLLGLWDVHLNFEIVVPFF